jgi:hypothetical protein
MKRTVFGASLGLAGLFVTTAAASAAQTVQVDRPCYVPTQEQRITGSGFTPNGDVRITLQMIGPHGQSSGGFTTTADGTGAIRVLAKTPQLASSDDTEERAFLSATDQQQAQAGTPPLTTTDFRVSIFDAFVSAWESKKGSPRKSTTFYAYGFEAVSGKTLYAHYVLRGRLRKTVAIGSLSGLCGDLQRSKRQFAFRPVPAGDYKVKLDATKRYPNSSPGYTYRHVRVSRAKAVR